jgi:hypothetical protein
VKASYIHYMFRPICGHQQKTHSFCYSTQLHRSHRFHPATHHRTRKTVHQFRTPKSSKDCTSTRGGKPTIYDLPLHQNNLYSNWFQQRIHKHRLYTNSSAYFRKKKTTLQTTKIYRRQNIYLHNTPASPPANTFYENYILTTISTTEEQKNATVFPTKTTTHAIQLNQTEVKRPRNYPTQNIEPQQLTKQRCHIPVRHSRSNSTTMILTGSNHITSRIHVSCI